MTRGQLMLDIILNLWHSGLVSKQLQFKGIVTDAWKWPHTDFNVLPKSFAKEQEGF